MVKKTKYVLCLHNDKYKASLERFKFYKQIPDEKSKELGLIRVIDESGESYLYPTEYFTSFELPPIVKKALVEVLH